jgi:hypothetical protein
MATGLAWDSLLALLESECGAGKREWYQYSKNAPPSLRVKRGERTVVYLLPGEDGFTASFAMGAKALALAREAGLGPYLEGARKYAEGTAVRVVVRGMEEVAVVVALARAKVAG